MAKILASARSSRTDMNGTLFLIDEPSAALHAQDSIHILTLIEKLRAQGATIICASNHPWFLERADKQTKLPVPNLLLSRR
jgi:excinuclease ABC subunit A